MAGITLASIALDAVFGTGYWVRVQGTLDLEPNSMPDPDLAVVIGDPKQPGPNLPTTALLVVEISDSTLTEDRQWKSSLYAAAGIADYWIVNLRDDCLEIRREPRVDSTARFGHDYGSLTTLGPGEFAAPLAAPSTGIAIMDLIPG